MCLSVVQRATNLTNEQQLGGRHHFPVPLTCCHAHVRNVNSDNEEADDLPAVRDGFA